MHKSFLNITVQKAIACGGYLLLAALLLFPFDAQAQIFNPLPAAGRCDNVLNGIGQVICNVVEGSELLPGLITAIAYLIGVIFAFTGIFKLKEHVLRPDQVPIWESVKRFAAGGALFALPIVTESLYNSIVGTGFGGLTPFSYTAFAGQTSGAGLDVIVAALVKDLWHPLHMAMGGFAYLAAATLTVIGILRIVKSSQEGARGPGGFGTIMTFATAGVLFSLPRVMGAFTGSMFGSSNVATEAIMNYTTGMTAVEVDHAHAVISAIIGFVALVGWISFIRGWFIIRAVAEGNQQASLMAGVTHIFGGALAVNLGSLLNAVQWTFGVIGVGVSFV